ncbi:MAG TPA: UDP-glucose 4-epimerase GalE [Phenylobacterium sp.]|jgi:UDP-arabinose 4-epimerase
MRVLVTGGAGYIGSHACKALAAAGHEPIVYDNFRTGHRWAVKWGPLERGNICDASRLADVMRRWRPEAVMHFAALAYIGESVLKPDLYYQTNVVGTCTLLDAMRLSDVNRIVFSSTCATYGAPRSMPIVETSPQVPVNPYGLSKLAAEAILRDHAETFGVAATALRYFNAAGADPDGEIGEEHDPEPHLLPLALQVALGRRSRLSIFGEDYDTPDGTCVRDYVHVTDLAAAHLTALETAAEGTFAAYNLGTGSGASVREVIAAVAEVTGRPVPARSAPRRPGDPPTLVADATLAHQALRWRARYQLRDMVESAWNWMTENRSRVGLRALSTPIPARGRKATKV